MIGRLTGTLYDKTPPRIGLEVQGVGYEVDVSMTTFYALPDLGSQVTLLTHLTVREDAHILFGFATAQERATFREVIKVTGIGARTALALLSGMSPGDLAQAVTMQEPARLTRVPGIGKKTAERLLLELRDRLPKASASSGAAVALPDAGSDIMNALLALGYSEREAVAAMRQLPEAVAVPEGIRQALKLLSKA